MNIEIRRSKLLCFLGALIVAGATVWLLHGRNEMNSDGLPQGNKGQSSGNELTPQLWPLSSKSPGRETTEPIDVQSSESELQKLILEYENAAGSEALLRLRTKLCEKLAEFPEFGKSWILTLPNHPSSTPLFRMFLKEYAMKDLTAATEFLSSLPPNQCSSAALTGICEAIVYASGANVALKFAEENHDSVGSSLDSVIADIVNAGMMKTEPESLLKVAERMDSGGHLKTHLLTGIIARGIREKPELFSEWISAQSTSPEGPEYFEAAINSWVRSDFVSASKWLLGQQPSVSRDAGIGSLVRHTSQDYPEDSIRWIGEISDPKLRRQQARNILARYSDSPDVLNALLDSASFDASEKASLLKEFGMIPPELDH